MDLSSNRFSVFQSEVSDDSEIVSKSTDEELKQETLGLESWKPANIGSWADAEEEEDENPPNSALPQTRNKNDTQTEIRKLDSELKNLTDLKISYKTRIRDKETGKFQDTTGTRTLRVISQQYYDQLQRLISKCKTHKGPNRDYYDAKEQKVKIKLANELLSSCAKDKNEPCSFVYSVVEIHSRNDGKIKIFTQNEVYPESKCYFECKNLTYRFSTSSE